MDKIRECGLCKKEKDLTREFFYLNAYGGLRKNCKDCEKDDRIKKWERYQYFGGDPLVNNKSIRQDVNDFMMLSNEDRFLKGLV